MKPGNGAGLDHVNTVRTGKSFIISIYLEGPACNSVGDLVVAGPEPLGEHNRDRHPNTPVPEWRDGVRIDGK